MLSHRLDESGRENGSHRLPILLGLRGVRLVSKRADARAIPEVGLVLQRHQRGSELPGHFWLAASPDRSAILLLHILRGCEVVNAADRGVLEEFGTAPLDLVCLIGPVAAVQELHRVGAVVAAADHLAAVGARCLAWLRATATAAVPRSLDHRAAERLHGLSAVGVVDNEVQHFLHRLGLQGCFGHLVSEGFDDARADLALGLFQ